jgi:hypothetical protein
MRLVAGQDGEGVRGAIKAVNARWGSRTSRTWFDPAAKQRAQANGMTVLASAQQGTASTRTLGQNDHELGFGQMRTRMAHGGSFVSPEPTLSAGACGMRRMSTRRRSRRRAATTRIWSRSRATITGWTLCRYAVMERFWDPVMEDQADGEPTVEKVGEIHVVGGKAFIEVKGEFGRQDLPTLANLINTAVQAVQV